MNEPSITHCLLGRREDTDSTISCTIYPLGEKKKERIIKKGQYMQTLHILPALRKKLQDSDGTFNLRKERKKGGKKKTHQFYCLLDYIEKYENLH